MERLEVVDNNTRPDIDLSQIAEGFAKESAYLLPGTKQALDDASSIGLDFFPCSPNEFPMIAPFTCSCEGSFGTGFQTSSECPKRVGNDLIPLSQNIDVLRSNASPDGTIACMMYVSSES